MSKILDLTRSELEVTIQNIETDQLLICADENVWKIYGQEIGRFFSKDQQQILHLCPEGEKTKTIAELERALEFFLGHGVHRKTQLLAFGGGATTDFGGMVAATCLRGIAWHAVPTSLLGMVDAAIGGKVAVNSKHGKNLIGAFHQPKSVWIDSSFLQTLPADHYQSGLGEVVKYGFLDASIGQMLLEGQPLQKVFAACGAHKQKIVEVDFTEQGIRKSLNFGHTIGHAIEKLYGIPHGIAVLWGMYYELKAFSLKDQINLLQKFSKAVSLEKLENPVQGSLPLDGILPYLEKDKKLGSRGSLEFWIPESPGNMVPKSVLLRDLPQFLQGL